MESAKFPPSHVDDDDDDCPPPLEDMTDHLSALKSIKDNQANKVSSKPTKHSYQDDE